MTTEQRPKRTLTVDELRLPEDVDRLDPRVFAEMAARPVNHIDLLRLQLDHQRSFERLANLMREALDELAGRRA